MRSRSTYEIAWSTCGLADILTTADGSDGQTLRNISIFSPKTQPRHLNLGTWILPTSLDSCSVPSLTKKSHLNR